MFQTHYAVFASDETQIAVFADSDTADIGFIASRTSAWLDDERTARIEVRDNDNMVRGIAYPPGKHPSQLAEEGEVANS